MRLDIYISKKCSITRNKAQFLIKQGVVQVDGVSIKKSSFHVKNEEIVNVLENNFQQYVSRSAIKLKEFLLQAKIEMQGQNCLDVGSSTGGFTQVMLENGARKVISVDVGTKQLHEKLKYDNRVVSIETTDIRNFETEEKFDFVVVDVSFISLRIILDKIFELAGDSGRILLLYKPQFEVGKKNINKKGVVKSSDIVIGNLENLIKEIEGKGKTIVGVKKSSLKGKNGNLEWFIYIN